MLVIAEVGDVARFPTARHLCAWAGLAPTVRSSDGKARLGHISHQRSPALRWALTEAAQKIPTGGGPLRATFERIAKRRGRNIAKIAIARQILTLCYHRLRDGEIRCLNRQPDIHDHDEELASAARPAANSQKLARITRARGARSGELAPMSGLLPPTSSRTAAHLIEPPSTARHPGPPRATGWMTGASSQAATRSANRRPTPRAPRPPPTPLPDSPARVKRPQPAPIAHPPKHGA